MNTLNYKTSRDYKRLAELAKKQSVICVVEYNGRPVTALSYYFPDSKRPFMISFPGYSFIDAEDDDRFIDRCEKIGVEFIEPEEVK